jgi:hypothetical protein
MKPRFKTLTPGDDSYWLAPKRRGGRLVRLTALPALTALCLVLTGCQTYYLPMRISHESARSWRKDMPAAVGAVAWVAWAAFPPISAASNVPGWVVLAVAPQGWGVVLAPVSSSP